MRKLAGWTVVKKPEFRRGYKNLHPGMRPVVDRVVADLASSSSPEKLGTYKSNMRVFSYELGRAYRILYQPVGSRGEIVLLRVCDHKSVYGKD